MGRIKEAYHEKICKDLERDGVLKKEVSLEDLDKAIKEVDSLYSKTMKRVDQTNRAKMQKIIDRENAMDLRAYETAIIALYDYKKWFDNNDPEDKEKIIEIDFALNRINQLIQEM